MDSTKSAKSFKTQCCLPITSPRPRKVGALCIGSNPIIPIKYWAAEKMQENEISSISIIQIKLAQLIWILQFFFFFHPKKYPNFFSFSFLSSNLHHPFLTKCKHTLQMQFHTQKITQTIQSKTNHQFRNLEAINFIQKIISKKLKQKEIHTFNFIAEGASFVLVKNHVLGNEFRRRWLLRVDLLGGGDGDQSPGDTERQNSRR